MLSDRDESRSPGFGTVDTADQQQLQAIVEMARSDACGALAAAGEFLADHSELPVAWRVLALATRMTGDAQAANHLDREAVAVGSRRPGLAAAEQAFAGDRLGEAEILVRAYLRDEDSKDAGAALLLGRIASRSGAYEQAENLARRAMLLAPGFHEATFTLARIQYDRGDVHPALNTLDELLTQEPDHLRALALKATLLMQLRDMAAADATFRKLHDSHPEDSRGWMNHGFMLKTIGRREDAILAYRRAIAADARNGRAWWGLANLRTVKFEEADIADMESALEREDLSSKDRIHLLFARGKALEGDGRFDKAFESFAAGAALRLSETPHDPAKVWDDVARVRRLFTPRFFAERQGWGCPAADPIFIVSLPRSGSTLVEQILASHSSVEGTEELFELERIALSIGSDAPGGYLDRIASLNRSEIRALGEAYLASAARFRDTGRPRFTDKMPSNWVFAGLVKIILPNAKIVDIRRHPLDCGVANFTQHFNWGVNFSYDLDHIGQFYSAYVHQMAHFDHTIPSYIHHMNHESLIDDLETQVRLLLDYLGLPFEPTCLRFHETRRPIHTPSSEQVREPINRKGIDRWRAYERWLEPLKAALGPVLDHYPLAPPECRPAAYSKHPSP